LPLSSVYSKSDQCGQIRLDHVQLKMHNRKKQHVVSYGFFRKTETNSISALVYMILLLPAAVLFMA